MPSDAATESLFVPEGNPKNEIASFGPSGPKFLQSQTRPRPENRLSISQLDVVHGQLCKHIDDCLQRTSDPGNKDAERIREGVRTRNGKMVWWVIFALLMLVGRPVWTFQRLYDSGMPLRF